MSFHLDKDWDPEFFDSTWDDLPSDESSEGSDDDSDKTSQGTQPQRVATQPTIRKKRTVDAIVNPAGILVERLNRAFRQFEHLDNYFITRALTLLHHVPALELAPAPPRALLHTKFPDAVITDVMPLLRPVTQNTTVVLRHFMHMYLRPKPHASDSTDIPCRIIGNPAALNARRKERPFQLITLSTMVSLLGELTPTWYTLDLDFKNYFPQVPIGEQTASLMAVCINDQHFLPRVLTQGWNSSTYIAQALSWAMVAFTLDGQDDLGLQVDWSAEVPPAYARLRNGGFMAILYDNIGLATQHKALRDKWYDRLCGPHGNFAHFNVVTKYVRCSTNNLCFCGLQFTIDSLTSELVWRTEPERFAVWTQRTFPKPTPAAASAIIQYLVRQQLLHLQPINCLGQELKIASLIGKMMAGKDKKEWRKETESLRDIMSHLRLCFAQMNNAWCRVTTRHLHQQVLLLAINATPTCLGWVLLNPMTGHILCKRYQYIEETTIATAESMAVSHFVRHNYYVDITLLRHLVVIIDNQVASRSYARGYSRCHEVDQEVQYVYSVVSPDVLLLIDTPSEHNISDGLTRDDKELNTADAGRRMRNTWRIYRAAVGFFSTNPSNWMSRVVLMDQCPDMEK